MKPRDSEPPGRAVYEKPVMVSESMFSGSQLATEALSERTMPARWNQTPTSRALMANSCVASCPSCGYAWAL